MNVFLWHVHGSYTTALVQGSHTYYIPVDAERGPDGRGRARTWEWPPSAIEVTRSEAAALAIDVVVVQRECELATLAREWLGRTPGRDLPTIYLEHNAPDGAVDATRHPAADRADLLLVHVTHFNALYYDNGATATRVVEHGIVDPGYRYTGELSRGAVVINEAARRGRRTGTDLIPRFERAAPIDLFGMGAAALGGYDLVQSELHDAMARRRVYVHPARWTSLGLSLIEAMHLGMPVVGIAATEACEAVPRAAGTLSTDVEALCRELRSFVAEPERAMQSGRAARAYALERYGLRRFLDAWDAVFAEVAA